METNGIEGGNDEGIKKEKKDKSGKFKGASSYKCQFCDKSFPRLGYLKKHEQVSELNSPYHHLTCWHERITYSYRKTSWIFSFIVTTLLFYDEKLSSSPSSCPREEPTTIIYVAHNFNL